MLRPNASVIRNGEGPDGTIRLSVGRLLIRVELSFSGMGHPRIVDLLGICAQSLNFTQLTFFGMGLCQF